MALAIYFGGLARQIEGRVVLRSDLFQPGQIAGAIVKILKIHNLPQPGQGHRESVAGQGRGTVRSRPVPVGQQLRGAGYLWPCGTSAVPPVAGPVTWPRQTPPQRRGARPPPPCRRPGSRLQKPARKGQRARWPPARRTAWPKLPNRRSRRLASKSAEISRLAICSAASRTVALNRQARRRAPSFR